MDTFRHHAFPTAQGICGIVWSDAGIYRAALPEQNEAALEARLLHGIASEAAAPEGCAAQAVAGITALMAGEPKTLDALPLDESATGEFDQKVYALCRAIPRGETRTYGALAVDLGDPTLSRAVGQSLGRNPFAPIVPCHRVTAADAKLGGFSATGGLALKTVLLRIEGAEAAPPPDLFEHFGIER